MCVKNLVTEMQLITSKANKDRGEFSVDFFVFITTLGTDKCFLLNDTSILVEVAIN